MEDRLLGSVDVEESVKEVSVCHGVSVDLLLLYHPNHCRQPGRAAFITMRSLLLED